MLGTDTVGRDILTRVAYAYRLSLLLGVVVLSMATPIGVIVGLLAGYLGGWRETVADAGHRRLPVDAAAGARARDPRVPAGRACSTR